MHYLLELQGVSHYSQPRIFTSFQTQTHLYLIHLSRRQGRGLGYEAVRHVCKEKIVYVSVTLCCRKCTTITHVMLDTCVWGSFRTCFQFHVPATHDMQSKLVMLFLPESYTYTVFFWHSMTSKTTTTSDEQKGSTSKERKQYIPRKKCYSYTFVVNSATQIFSAWEGELVMQKSYGKTPMKRGFYAYPAWQSWSVLLGRQRNVYL